MVDAVRQGKQIGTMRVTKVEHVPLVQDDRGHTTVGGNIDEYLANAASRGDYVTKITLDLRQPRD